MTPNHTMRTQLLTEMGKPGEFGCPEIVDAINAVIAARAQGESISSILGDSQATHAALLTQLEAMTTADLGLPYSHYQPDDPPPNTKPVAAWIHGNTWDHYDEHIGWLQRDRQQT